MDEKLNKQSIDRLDISDNCMELLKSNDIDYIKEHIENIKKEKAILLDLKNNIDAKGLVKK